jgi:CheY-like chemotaxis protein
MEQRDRILIIDDDAAILERMRARLSSLGFEVATTTQTVGAARYLAGCDLAIIDFYMPGMDGGTVVASLRSAVRGQAGPAFYLYTSDEAKAELYQRYGFDGVFTKKGDDEALAQQVSAFFRLTRLRRLSKTRASRGPK